MNKCVYCNGELEAIDSFTAPLFKDIDAEFELWINTGHLCVDLVSVNNSDPPDGDLIELISRKINYCPMCGRKLTEEGKE